MEVAHTKVEVAHIKMEVSKIPISSKLDKNLHEMIFSQPSLRNSKSKVQMMGTFRETSKGLRNKWVRSNIAT